MRIRTAAAAPLALAVAAGLAACHSHEQKRPSASDHFKKAAGELTQGAKQMASNVEGSASDTAITAHVKARLASHQGLSSFSIHVSTDKGVVTLTGTVGSKAASALAAQVTGKTKDVRVVVNKLEVKQDD